jgi:hypothetical protein
MLQNIVLFLVAYLMLIIIGTLVVGGWFFVTRGSIETLPDGTRMQKGKIFRSWYFFWMQEKSPKRKIYYTGAQLRLLARQQLAPYFGWGNMVVNDSSLELVGGDFRKMIGQVENDLNIKFLCKGPVLDGDAQIYSIFREFTVYRFPEWVRHPLAQCATCFSSIYGSLFYWGMIPFLGRDLYSWAQMPILAMIFFWVCFCFSLSIPLTALAKKYN